MFLLESAGLKQVIETDSNNRRKLANRKHRSYKWGKNEIKKLSEILEKSAFYNHVSTESLLHRAAWVSIIKHVRPCLPAQPSWSSYFTESRTQSLIMACQGPQGLIFHHLADLLLNVFLYPSCRASHSDPFAGVWTWPLLLLHVGFTFSACLCAQSLHLSRDSAQIGILSTWYLTSPYCTLLTLCPCPLFNSPTQLVTPPEKNICFLAFITTVYPLPRTVVEHSRSSVNICQTNEWMK